MKFLITSVLFFSLISCHKSESGDPTVGHRGPGSGVNPEKPCNPGDPSMIIDCTSDIPFSSNASKTKTCNSLGSGFDFGSCTVYGCLANYHLDNNSCVSNACTPNQSYGVVSCVDEIANSSFATKTKTCDDSGSGFVYGTCTVLGCLSNYHLDDNTCIPNTCTPNQSYGLVSCTDEISNSSDASKSKSCNASGSDYVYGSCQVSGCLPNFHLENNSCIANACTPNQSYGLVDCSDEVPFSSTATKSITCNSIGDAYLYGTCSASGCLSNYHLKNNSCIANTCNPNQSYGLVDCTSEVPFADSATKSKTCDDEGEGYLYGTCNVTGCLPNYHLENNSCVPNTCNPGQSYGVVSCVDEIPYSESATKSKSCNDNGSDYIYGSCNVSGCEANYHLENNSCVANVCTPNQSYGVVSCVDEVANSSDATKPKTCNSNGSGYLYGSCSVSGCESNYHLEGSNSCVANKCTPNQSYGVVSCVDEIENSSDASKSKTCNAIGSGYLYGACSVAGCLPDYHLEGNSCVANICTPNQSYGVVSCVDEIANSSDASKTKTCNANGSNFVYGTCSVAGCLPDYHLVGNSCVANTCNSNQSYGLVSCIDEIENSVSATKTKTCNNNGSDYVYGSCSVTGCASGYNLQGNSCIVNDCNPNQSYGLVNCLDEISNSSDATKTKTCNAQGSGYLYGSCTASSCLTGFNLQGNSCIANECNPNQSYGTVSCIDEIPNASIASKTKTCNNSGSNYLYGSCTVSSCLSGYNLQGNSCIANECNPNQSYGTVSCVNEIPNSLVASKTKTCNGQGSDFIYGSCSVSSCQTGYVLSNNSCLPIGFSIVSAVSITEGNSGVDAITFTVTLSAAMNVSTSVYYATSDGSATKSDDYSERTGTLNFPAGTTSKTFTVNVKGDKNAESTEVFYVNLSNAQGAVIISGQSTVTILDND